MEILSIVLQILLILMFLMAGLGKIIGSKMHIEGFNHWRLPQWFRVVTGIVEFAAAVALIIGFWEQSWVAIGALILGVTAIGGIITHMRVKDSLKQTFPIIFLGILSFILLIINISELSNFPGFK
jgi:putative oxidoreductase